MSVIACEECSDLVDSDDDPDCFVEAHGVIHEYCRYCRVRLGLEFDE